ncbi:MFS transporter [Pseudoduganella namucuonensis]|uniref:Predicted arabinose efflux permease, MFS family n=1 Tax=Pseudoduganella namucuonensis TaxID=1035707 RepID=A0A1I7JE54_9BURK|nr:MFS transporter [Pseudoduganella namucuonensis]SFU83428.1 Predicted arabinose efflux permease, MFS family [Pseudoduganella namucuonensis]
MTGSQTRPGLADCGAPRAVVATVMGCHFIAAFAALGMPPFFALILNQSLQGGAPYLAGWLYVLPTFFTALSSPWWGRVADRYGKKPLLLRAQLGLAASFLLASYANDVPTFVAALVLQGLLGGTFSASNAYLATVVSGPALARSLTLMQWSARAALVAAPAALGWLVDGATSPLELYRWLALLPLVAALCIWRLPAPDQPPASKQEAGAPPVARRSRAGGNPSSAPLPASGDPAATPRQVYVLQWLFVFATVLTFPYFVPYLREGGALTAAAAGLLFGLPHLVYLVCAVPLTRWLGKDSLLPTLALACLLLAASLFGQAWSGAEAWPLLAAWRLLMGLGMTMAYLALHGLIAAQVHSGNAGRTFGWFESSSKWGAVAAGLAAGALAQAAGLRAPFVIGGAAMLAAAGLTAWIASSQLHLNNRSQHANK